MTNVFMKLVVSILVLQSWSASYASVNCDNDDTQMVSHKGKRKLEDLDSDQDSDSLHAAKKIKVEDTSLASECIIEQLPVEMQLHILSYLSYPETKIHHFNIHFFQLSTNCPIDMIARKGFISDDESPAFLKADLLSNSKKKIDFKLFPDVQNKIPSYILHNFIYEFVDIPESDLRHIKNTNVQKITFQRSNITSNSDRAIEISTNLCESKVKFLDLSNNYIDDVIASQIIRILTESKVVVIDLSSNQIQNYGQLDGSNNSNENPIVIVSNTPKPRRNLMREFQMI